MIKATSDQEEGRLVAYSIFEEKSNQHRRYGDFVILYRTNSQSRAMEEALRKRNIKYKIIGGLSFYQRKEIKDPDLVHALHAERKRRTGVSAGGEPP